MAMKHDMVEQTFFRVVISYCMRRETANEADLKVARAYQIMR